MENDFEVFDIDLSNEEELNAFEQKIARTGNFFKPSPEVSYKIKFKSPVFKAVEKTFDGEKKIQYQVQISAVGNNGEKFEGIWEIGVIIADMFLKAYKKDKDLNSVFVYNKTGTGKQTKHSLVKDF